jgi:hypothetical protein
VYQEVSSQLLGLAAIDQGVFKAVVGGMDASQRAFLEDIIRSGQQASTSGQAFGMGETNQPTIALKLDFGR